jgi:23S rRNA pseudouridine1911/1915/1917 synthase
VNEGFLYRERIDGGSDGATVLAHLARRYRHSSATVWRARIEAGEVEIDGVRAAADAILRAGQSLTWRRPPWEEPAVPLAYAVLHRDRDLLAVAKPRGLPCVPNGGFLTHTLLHLVRRDVPEAVPLHRLGRGTSGLVLFARTPEARRLLAAAWREGRVEKDYRALVRGHPSRESFSVDVRIGPVAHPRLGAVHAASPLGKPALSHVRTREPRGDDRLVDVRIDTGRPHQIRIHLAAAGHPLVGDPLYVVGGVPGETPGLPGDVGYRLHACRLAFDHPTTGRRVAIECAPPPALRDGGPGSLSADGARDRD